MNIRLQKYLADCGIASRRAAEGLIEKGLVSVNGVTIKEQGVKVNPDHDTIKYKGKIVRFEKVLKYYMLNKPTKCMTTLSDENSRRTILDLVKVKERIYPVGRLDYMSSGLLLLTNDGDLTYKLTHPKHHVEKRYIVSVEPKVSNKDVKLLEKGVSLEAYTTAPCEINLLEENKKVQVFEVVLHEGKNRQIRKMFEHIGGNVTTLKRVSMGDLNLGQLKSGEFRELTKQEVNYLKNI
jgi:pseudouridine synthase